MLNSSTRSHTSLDSGRPWRRKHMARFHHVNGWWFFFPEEVSPSGKFQMGQLWKFIFLLYRGIWTNNYGNHHHAIHGTTHYFDWAIFNSYVKLPKGTCSMVHPSSRFNMFGMFDMFYLEQGNHPLSTMMDSGVPLLNNLCVRSATTKRQSSFANHLPHRNSQ